MTHAILSLASASPSYGGSSSLERLLEEVLPSSTASTRRALLNAAHLRPFEGGDLVVAQGEHASFGFVVDGIVAARRTTPDGRAMVPVVLGRGRIFASMVLAGRETLFDYVGIVPGVTAFWSGVEARSLAAADAGLALDLLSRTLDGAGELATRLDTMHYQDARRRVARVLLVHRDLCFGEHPPVARTELSLLVGTSKEMTRRVLGRLEADGAVERIGRAGLELRDADRLRDLAGYRAGEADG
jgi:CRP-like cAMP-binding protein